MRSEILAIVAASVGIVVAVLSPVLFVGGALSRLRALEESSKRHDVGIADKGVRLEALATRAARLEGELIGRGHIGKPP